MTDRDKAKNDPQPVAKRVRLSAQARHQQILAAALAEFSSIGFEGATMDRIAQRTGLTKAGVYAHFESKEQILEALLISNIFNTSEPPLWQFNATDCLEDAVAGYLDRLYRLIEDPHIQATFRLLLIESGRSPERVRRWSQEIFQPYTIDRQKSVQDSVSRGLLPDSQLARKFYLASSPALQALMSLWLLGPEDGEREVQQIRAWHQDMLLTMLRKEETQ